MKKQSIHFMEMVLGITAVCAGAALGIIAALGQTTSTGTSWSIAGALGIKVGYGLIILYCFIMLLQVIALGRNFKLTAFIQFVPVVLHGWILNFFKYDFPPFLALNPQTYAERFLIYAVVMIACGITYVIFNHLIMVQVVILIIVAGINAYFGYYNGVMDLAEEMEYSQLSSNIQLEEQYDTIASNRIDCIIAKAFHLSRSESAQLLIEEKVFINGKCITNCNASCEDGAIVSVRGKSRFVFVRYYDV